MKIALTLLVMAFVSGCGGPEVPTAFLPDSPASTASPPALQWPVASVLVAADPLEATVCPPEKACALVDLKGEAAASENHHETHHGHEHHHGQHH